jgi:hypothetical protein
LQFCGTILGTATNMLPLRNTGGDFSRFKKRCDGGHFI